MSDEQQKRCELHTELKGVQMEINQCVEDALALDKAKIEEQGKEIAALKATQEAHARSLHELWGCIRTGSQGDL